MLRFAAAIITGLLWITMVPAALVVTSTPGLTHETDGYSTFATQSADMIGLEVTVEFLSGNVDTQLWSATGIAATDWSMTQGPGSTYNSRFQLTNLTNDPIISFVMHGGFTDTLFDRSVSPSTPGTGNGRDLFESGTYLSFFQDIDVNYFDEIQTVGSTPVGDIYAGLQVDFEYGFTNRFRFIADTDTASTLIRPTVSGVPEPNSFAAALVMWLCLCVRRKKRQRST